ncbi:glycerophosphodiester phosphodiesterase family protein [Hydrogenibacillus sp. N12]|uniref:glycerophosphodiester phosphodiesterase family protein n=1 Tax=Hydrogenibacillus sp. N12 TaxID=2866627 RepID=UPI001C7CE8C7|nr:glycerophosphodiester phosphodiesterase family protein [Hydrogenibacillus sp. N12]QZA33482.1 glycerophosphodiester phosphodiesterase [Hydrogenibacillus sp. N12]
MEIWAHRGASAVAPENTLAAFQAALLAGADGIELDVQLTRDGVVVVIHDETLERTTDGSGFVHEKTWAELARLDAGRWFHPDFRGERVPRLEDVLVWARGTNLRLNIELKNALFPMPGLEETVVALLHRHDLVERTVLSSFNHESVRRLRHEHPEVRAAILYVARLFDPCRYLAAIGGADLHPYYLTVSPELAAHAAACGARVRAFTVDRPEDIRLLQAYGVHGVITNRPAEARQALLAVP